MSIFAEALAICRVTGWTMHFTWPSKWLERVCCYVVIMLDSVRKVNIKISDISDIDKVKIPDYDYSYP